MTLELNMLALSVVLGLVQIVLASHTASLQTFPLFAAAVLAAHVAGKHNWMTEWGVQLYFWARVAYVAFYAGGLFLVRSLVWNVGTLGIVLILLSLI